MVHLFSLWKGLEDIRNTPLHKSVEVAVGKFVSLVEEAILLLV